jgi:hypothetical protein
LASAPPSARDAYQSASAGKEPSHTMSQPPGFIPAKTSPTRGAQESVRKAAVSVADRMAQFGKVLNGADASSPGKTALSPHGGSGAGAAGP